jgi:cytochrome c oxidase subunit 4
MSAHHGPEQLEDFGDPHHVSPVSLYITIFLLLMVMTGVTVGAAYVDLGALNLPVAVAIACFKATIVILYFMHVKYSSKIVKLTAATGFFFLIILFGITITDYMTRNIVALGK